MFCHCIRVFFETRNSNLLIREIVNPILDGFFGGFSRMKWGWQKDTSFLPKVHDTYPTMMKLGKFDEYLSKADPNNVSSAFNNTPAFFTRN